MSRKVEINLPVEKMGIGKISVTEGAALEVTFGVICKANPGEIARVATLLKQGIPLYLVVGSAQAELDMGFYNIEVGKQAGAAQLPLENAEKLKQEELFAQAEKILSDKNQEEALAETAALTEEEHNHNGHAEVTETVDTASFIDLSTFDQRPANGPTVPHIFFLLGRRVECVNNNLKAGLLELFSGLDLQCQTPEELSLILEKYPISENRSIMLEILKTPSESDQMFANLEGASADYQADKAAKPKRSRKKKTETEEQPVIDTTETEEAEEDAGAAEAPENETTEV